jgi:hypothetical protein
MFGEDTEHGRGMNLSLLAGISSPAIYILIV